jgi:predicted dehydrogenase
MRSSSRFVVMSMAAIATAALIVAGASVEGTAETQAPLRADENAPLRIGLIGLDTSHAVAFTELLNDGTRRDHIPGGRVVAAYKGGSPGLPMSDTRIERFTADVTGKWGVELVDSIEKLLTRVDAVMLLSVDARQHLAQVRPVLAAHKRVFIDKPIAPSYRDTRAIADLARETGTPFFSSSSLRYSPHIQRLREQASRESEKAAAGADASTRGAFTWGPAQIEPTLPDLFWYGIHSIESLYALMGPGCETVTRVNTAGADVVSCRWRDGRIGTFRGNRNEDHAYGAIFFGNHAAFTDTSTSTSTSTSATTTTPETKPDAPKQSDYYGLVVEIMKFFKSGVPPVPPDETLELIAFMEAAELSKSRGGAPVPLTEITRSDAR